MDLGLLIYVITRLALGALAAFFAIMLWSRTRDIAWMLMVIGTIAVYIETVFSILELFGITGNYIITIGSMPFTAILLPNLPTGFFLSAFIVMVSRKYRNGK